LIPFDYFQPHTNAGISDDGKMLESNRSPTKRLAASSKPNKNAAIFIIRHAAK
jgi:hypothetical protein